VIATRLAGVRIEVCSSREISRRLVEFDLDVGLTYLNFEGDAAGLGGQPLYSENYLLLTPADNELADRDAVSWAEAAANPLCALGRQMQNRRILELMIANEGATFHPVIQTATVEALYAHVATRRWSSIIAHPWLHAFRIPDGVRVVSLTPQPSNSTVGLIWSAQLHESVVATALFDSIRDVDVAGQLDSVLNEALGTVDHATAAAEPSP
jgi:DNA-binding transcriptional LysR family regulator